MKRTIVSGITALMISLTPAPAALAAAWVPVNDLPAGLDEYYPPKASGPAYLFQMLELERAFSGIAAELVENDLFGAREEYAEFIEKYRSTRGMVKEWQEAFPQAEVEALGRALQGKDRGAMFKSLDDVGARCHECHAETMVTTQQKYRWGNFSSLTVDENENGAPKPYAVFKKFVATNMAGVDVDARQGQWGNARKHFSELESRLGTLSETCVACHAVPPRYLTDVHALESLRKEIEKETPDKTQVSGLLKALGGEACAGCHLIHVPAAMRTVAAH